MVQSNLERLKAGYWAKLVEVKTAACYIERYRTHLGKWVTGLASLRAIASSVSIGAWAVWREYAFVWGAIIAGSQVADALRDVIPFAKKHKAAGELAVRLNRLVIDAQLEWDNIIADKYTEDQIIRRLNTLRMRHHTAECELFKEGLPRRDDLFEAAQLSADNFFHETYGVQSVLSGGRHGRLEAEVDE